MRESHEAFLALTVGMEEVARVAELKESYVEREEVTQLQADFEEMKARLGNMQQPERDEDWRTPRRSYAAAARASPRPVPTSNRFSMLPREEESRDYRSQQAQRPQQRSPRQPQRRPQQQQRPRRAPRGRIHLYADSQGRGVAEKIGEIVPTARATGTVKAGAGMAEVVEGVRATANGLGYEDCAVIIGGTNNAADGRGRFVADELRVALDQLKATNVIVTTIPWRYDERRRREDLDEVRHGNEEIKGLAKRYRNVRVLDLAAFGRGCYTRDGFHLNSAGKSIIADVVYSHMWEVASRQP